MKRITEPPPTATLSHGPWDAAAVPGLAPEPAAPSAGFANDRRALAALGGTGEPRVPRGEGWWLRMNNGD